LFNRVDNFFEKTSGAKGFLYAIRAICHVNVADKEQKLSFNIKNFLVKINNFFRQIFRETIAVKLASELIKTSCSLAESPSSKVAKPHVCPSVQLESSISYKITRRFRWIFQKR
jgi:hypothetical protein